MSNRHPVLVDLPRALVGDGRQRLMVEIAIALERTVGDCETLCLDNESDKAVLISRLKRALGLTA